jgi:uncharacterized LabA/DUF88 family protein
MDRFGIFVDAGYLYAASGKLCYETVDRSKLVLRADSLHPALVELARSECELEHLRTFWYDGAPRAQPTSLHLDIAILPGIKLRLGRLMRWGQKGVDSRVVRDLIILAFERAISTAYLLGGDEDLREGVAEAQERGLRVVLMAVEPLNEQNLSPTLAMEVDDIITLDKEFLSPHLALREEVQVEEFEVEKTDDPKAAGRAVGTQWYERTAPSDRDNVRRWRPRIPRELDAALLGAARSALGAELDDEMRKQARAGFWEAIDALAAEPPPGR